MATSVEATPKLDIETRLFINGEFVDSPSPKRPAPRGPASICQTPERSGFPPMRATGPSMFTLPSAVRGALGSGLFSH